MGWKIIIGPSAQADLATLFGMSLKHNSDAAARLGYELITRAENLANFPEIGRIYERGFVARIVSSIGCGLTSNLLILFGTGMPPVGFHTSLSVSAERQHS
jgi:hypothetical protein